MLRPLCFAFQFFTNIALPGKTEWNEKTAAASLAWLPLTGLVLGTFLAALVLVCQNAGFPRHTLLLAVMVTALELWTGGALFLDGFCDSCDGLLSRRDKGRMLEIMKDSRLGTMGALGLVLALSAKLALLTELAAGREFVYVLLYYPCWARWSVSFCVCNFPAAKEEGLAFFFKAAQKPVYFLFSSMFALAALFFMPRYFSLAAAASLIVLLFCCRRIQNRLGGQTGDTYGLACVAGELSFLFFAAFGGAFF